MFYRAKTKTRPGHNKKEAKRKENKGTQINVITNATIGRITNSGEIQHTTTLHHTQDTTATNHTTHTNGTTTLGTNDDMLT